MFPIRYKRREFSFTLVETILAIGLLAPVILYVASVQGNAVYFVEYGQKSSQAIWLAQRIMSQVEYHSKIKDLKELEVEVSKQKFQDLEGDFTFDLSILPFKLPLAQMISKQITGGGGGDEDGGSVEEVNPLAGGFEEQIKTYIGDDLFKIAKVTVFWPEGAKRNSNALNLIIYNQKKIEEVAKTLEGISSSGGGGLPGGTTGSGTPTGTSTPSGGAQGSTTAPSTTPGSP